LREDGRRAVLRETRQACISSTLWFSHSFSTTIRSVVLSYSAGRFLF
jgi:hypothetical protein